MEKDGVIIGVYTNSACLCLGQIVNGEVYVQPAYSSISYNSTNKEWTVTNSVALQATIYVYEID